MSKSKSHKAEKKDLVANDMGSEKVEADISKIQERAGADKTLSKKDKTAA